MKNTEKELSFLDHLEVLRWHLLRAGSSILIFATLAFIYKDFVFDQVLLAPMNSNFPTYIFLVFFLFMILCGLMFINLTRIYYVVF